MSDGLKVELELDDGQFTTGIIRAGQSVQQFKDQVGQGITAVNQMGEASKSFLSTLRDVSIVSNIAAQGLGALHTATTSWVGEIVKVNAEFERMTTVMRTLSTSGDPMKESMESVTALREMAKNAPFSLNALHDSFTRLNAAGLKPAEGLMHSLVDAVSAFGGGDDVIRRASLAFQEMAGKGVVQMKELRNQLGMAVPNAMKLLARSTGESYSDMMSDIHTGTVNAKDAILSLQLEFERSFGGAAQTQMQTFNGQLARMSVLVQDIAIKHVGKPLLDDGSANTNGFFEAVKKQATDLNGFLDSGTAKGMGDMLGEDLTSAVLGFRHLVDTVVEFRHEIMAAGQGLAYAFGGILIIKGIGAIKDGIMGVGQQLVALKINLETAGAAWRTYRAFQDQAQGVTQGPMGAAGPRNASVVQGPPTAAGVGPKAVSMFAGAGAAAMAWLPVMTTGVGALVTVLPLLGMALGAAADHFDLFGHKAKDAWMEMKRFGAESEAEAAKAGRAYLAQLATKASQANKTLNKDTADHEYLKGVPALYNSKMWLDRVAASKKAVLDAQKELDDASKEYATRMQQGRDADAERNAKPYNDAADEKSKARQRAYNLDSDKRDNLFAEMEKRAGANHQSAGLMKTDHQAQVIKDQIAYYTDLIKIQEDEIEVAKKLMAVGGDNTKENNAQGASMYDTALKKKMDLERQMASAMALDPGMHKDPKVQDDQKIKEKAEQQLTKLKGDVEGYAAAIRGADVDSERLYELWERIKGGDINAPGIQQLIENLRLAKAEADALDKIMRGGQALSHDIEQANIKASEKLFEAQHKGISDTDKIAIKMKEGFYDGYGGETPMQKAMTKLRQTVLETGEQSKIAGADLLNMVGSTLLTKVQTITGALGGVVDKMKEISANSNIELKYTMTNPPDMYSMGAGKVPDALGGPGSFKPGSASENERAGSLYSFFTQSGLNPTAASGIIGNFHQESNLDPTLVNSTGHFGMGQWDQERQGKLKAYASSQGKDPTDALVQAAFTLKEMAEKFPGLLQQMQMAKSPGDAAVIFRKAYEKPGEAEANDPNRMGYAEQVARTRGGRQDFDHAYKGPIYQNDSREQIPANATLEQRQQFDAAMAKDQAANAQIAKNTPTDKLKELQTALERIKLNPGGDESNYAKLVAGIKSTEKDSLGSLSNNHDPDSAVWKDKVAVAKQYDEALKAQLETKKKNTAADGAIKAQDEAMIQMKEKLANITDRNNKKPAYSDDVERQREAQMKEYNKVVDAKGKDSPEAAASLQKVNDFSKVAQQVDLEDYIQTLAKKTEAAKKATMSQTEQGEEILRKEKEQLDKRLAMADATAEQIAQVNVTWDKWAATEREALLSKTPIGSQMKQWGELNKNLEQGVTSWMSSSIDALSTLAVTGKTNWSQLSQSILKDLTQLTMKSAVSGLFNTTGANGLLSGVGGSGSGGLGSMLGGIGKLFGIGVAHTGGILGTSLLATRSGSMLDFIGAPRFHTGGVIGQNEVPIIAQKGEGVFTKDQMAAMGNKASTGKSGSFAIHNNLTINASGGTDQQNEDLAQRTQAKLEHVTRTLIVSELAKQMRPGNLLNH